MENIFDGLMTGPVALVAFTVGGVMQAVKASATAAGVKPNTAWFKAALALAPVGLGAIAGYLVIPEGGVTDPWLLGVVSGLISSSVYNAMSPIIKTWTAGKVVPDGGEK